MAKINKVHLFLMLAILFILLYIVYKSYYENFNVVPSLEISIPEAKARRFGLIIDVRTPKERNELGYYPNSIPISLERLQKQVPLDISSKNTWILVYCNTGTRSKNAANILYNMGYHNVRYITKSYLSLMPGSK